MGFQHHRKPFLSAEGYVGLVPAVAEIGDIIIIIFGATVPFVVRELDSGKVQLIGEAFVYGIMDGEFLKVGFPLLVGNDINRPTLRLTEVDMFGGVVQSQKVTKQRF